MESWQSGNAPDSKSGEPSFPWRAGSNPVLSLYMLIKPIVYCYRLFVELLILTYTSLFQ